MRVLNEIREMVQAKLGNPLKKTTNISTVEKVVSKIKKIIKK